MKPRLLALTIAAGLAVSLLISVPVQAQTGLDLAASTATTDIDGARLPISTPATDPAPRYYQATHVRRHYLYKKGKPNRVSVYAVVTTWNSPQGADGRTGGSHMCMRDGGDGPPGVFYGDFDRASGFYVGHRMFGGPPFRAREAIRTSRKRAVLSVFYFDDPDWQVPWNSTLPEVSKRTFLRAGRAGGFWAKGLTKPQTSSSSQWNRVVTWGFI
ncbi:MAG: hypothetical protein WCP28_21230, partial [Actinomycetes bacterium]